jgi:hypothetical protein
MANHFCIVRLRKIVGIFTKVIRFILQIRELLGVECWKNVRDWVDYNYCYCMQSWIWV